MKLPESFYERKNVVKIARELLGKSLFTNVGNIVTGGIIVETEAYSWKEKGCHAFGGKMTERNKIMFGKGGYAYVYLCYGMHHLFNVVTNIEGTADAILIRAIQPTVGIEKMKHRRGEAKNPHHLTSGPGKLTQALQINRTFNGKYLLNNDVWIEDLGVIVKNKDIIASKRIGIEYAGEDASLLWRFTINNNKWISR